MAPGRTPSKPGTIEGNTPDLETEVASSQRLAVHRHLILQSAVILLPLAVVPLGIPNGWCLPSDGAPAAWALLILTVMVGLELDGSVSTVIVTANSETPGLGTAVTSEIGVYSMYRLFSQT